MRKATKTLDQVNELLETTKEDKREEPKKLAFKIDDATGLYVICYNNGGEVPDALKGSWTSGWRAQAAIDNFLTKPVSS